MGPLVSVIMGVYNGGDLLSRSIESILNQTYENIEFIICNDKSTDKSIDIINKYSRADSRISVLENNKNLGLPATLNHCLRYAGGKYIARQDADDISLPDRIKKQVSFLENSREFDMVGSDAYLVDENENLWGIYGYAEKPTQYDLIRSVCHIHASIIVTEKMIRYLNGYNEKAHRVEDYELFFRIYSKGFKGFNIKEPLIKVHYDEKDYKRRKYKYRIIETRVRLTGYKALKLPLKAYIYILKPLIVGLIPNKLMHKYHSVIYKSNIDKKLQF